MNLTDRPTAPDCDVWPKCGCDVTGRPCHRTPAATTVPAAPADPVPALVALALELRVKSARLRRGEAALSPTDAARLRKLVAAEQDRLGTAGREGA